MESLQILKFIYKKEQLNFTAGLKTVEHEPANGGDSAQLLGELFTEDSADTTDKLLRVFGEGDSDDG